MPSAAFTVLLVMTCACYLTSPVAAQAGAEQINKVVELLEGMKKQIENDGEKDKDAYDKYMCWCEKTIEELEENIKTGKKSILKLKAYLDEQAGLQSELKIKIDVLENEEIPSDNDAKQTAEEQRKKEYEEFVKEEQDLKDCIAALKEAIAVLSKVQLLQMQGKDSAHVVSEARPALLQLQRMSQRGGAPFAQFRSVMQKDLFDALDSLDGESKAVVKKGAFLTKEVSSLLPWEKTEEQKGLEAKPNELEGNAAGAKSYNSRSGQILGILKAMLDEMLKDLAYAQKTELEATIAFHKLRSAKVEEIKTNAAMLEDYELQLSKCLAGISQAEVDLESTEKALGEDEKALDELKRNCEVARKEYATRVAARNEEIRAIAETIKILTSDESRDLFAKTVTFIQVDSVTAVATKQRRATEKAVGLVLGVARKHKDLVLASVMVRTRLDAFTKVKKMMDEMLVELKAQQKAEEEKKEFCNKEIDSTEDSIKEGQWDLKNLKETKLELENTIKTLESDIVSLNDAIAALEQSLKKAGEERKEENQIFQKNVADQRITAAILKKALARLEMYYGKKFLQVRQHTATEPPPPKPFAGSYQKKGLESGGPMGLLTEIIKNAEAAAEELVADEQSAQESYAAFAQDANDTIEADRASILEKTEALAKTKAMLSETDEAILAKDAELTKLSELLSNLHAECDFIMKYFDIRQAARQDEMNSIEEAKAILSGANFS